MKLHFINLLKIQTLWLHDSRRDAYPFKMIHPTNLVKTQIAEGCFKQSHAFINCVALELCMS